MLPKNRPPTHPGRLLAETLTQRGITQGAFAKRIGVSVQTMNTLINGKRALTAEMAVRIGKALETSPEMWLGMQMDRDLWFALHKDHADHYA